MVVRKRSFLKRLFLVFRPFWWPLFITFSVLIILQLIGTLSPYLFGKSVDAVIHKNVSLTFLYLGIAFVSSYIQEQALWWIKERNELKKLDDWVQQYFSVRSLEKMFGFSIGQHSNEHSGVRQIVATKGQSALISLMYSLLYNILPSGIQVVVTIVVLAIFDWRIALVAIIFITIYGLIAIKINNRYYPKFEFLRKQEQEQSKLESELYRNTSLVLSEAQEIKTLASYDSFSKKVALLSTTTWLNYFRNYFLSRSLITIGQYATLGIGVYFILTGQHSTGMFVTLFSWTAAIFGNVTSIINNQRSLIRQIVEIRKLFNLFDIQSDIDPNIGGKTIEPLAGSVEFKNVSFAYPYRQSKKEIEEEIQSDDKEQEHAVENVSLTIPAGAKVGFVGVSGSGKSTIVNLMRRFYDPTKGEILIDGVPLRELDLRWFRSRIGNVEQKIDLFDRSVRENIVFGLSESETATEEMLEQVVKDASLSDFVTKLKDHGLDTVIGEGGIKVSGGERQRIGIARALIKNPKILIFDEATSALDSINEKLIHDAINRSAEGRTTIIIAHRLSTVMDADIIFVVANGRVVDSGTHKELEKRCEEYQKLIKNQILVS